MESGPIKSLSSFAFRSRRKIQVRDRADRTRSRQFFAERQKFLVDKHRSKRTIATDCWDD